MNTDLPTLDWEKMNGLIPAVVTHYLTGKVLMVAWCNETAVQHTLESGDVTFYSRSRQALWTKGETSGHTLKLVSLRTDCDRDTLLIDALPAGPVCHTGTSTCFDTPNPLTGAGFLGELERIIDERKRAPAEGSYTARLLSQGHAKVAQKVGEEGVEVALAGVQSDRAALIGESADLVYHLLVLLSAHEVPFDAVLSELNRRHTQPRERSA
ncbi:MAG: bifunctional phosphoribosyl-AMP cyclohydrolase/phosphoribosyl-ATP diphosphatase HisIE [Pseudomonadota bacterium]